MKEARAVSIDVVKALELYREAAKRGHPDATQAITRLGAEP